MPLKLEALEKQAERMLKATGLNEPYLEIGGKITTKLGLAAMWPAGSYLTNKAVDANKDNLTEQQQRIMRFTGNMAFGAPILYHAMGKPFVEDLGNKEWADAAMSGLSLGIGGAGVWYNNREFMSSAATLGFLFSLAGDIEDHIVDKGKESFAEIEKCIANTGHRILGGGNTESVDAEELEPGETIKVRQGDYLPTDGELLDDSARVKDPVSFNGEPGRTHTKPKGAKLAQGLQAQEDMHVKVTATQKESTLSRLQELYEEGGLSKKETSIKNIVNKGYVPLMLAAVAAQFAYRYNKDEYRHDQKARKKEAKVTEAIADPDSPHSHIAKLQKEATAYRYSKDSSHSFQSGLDRATQLAIKMAPCAIMAGLLIYPFARFRLRAKHGVTINSEHVFDNLLNETGTIVSDFRGPIAKYGSPVRWKKVFNGEGKLIEESEKEAQEFHEMHGHTQYDNEHALSESIREELNMTGEPPEFVKIKPGYDKGVKATIGEDGLFVSGTEKFVKGQLGEAVEIPTAVTDELTKASDPVLSAYKKADGTIHWGVMDAGLELHKESVSFVADHLKKGEKFVIASGTPEDTVSEKLIAALKEKGVTEAQLAKLEIKAGISSAEKIDVVNKHLAGHKKQGFFIGDGINDMEAAAAAKKQGAISVAIDNQYSGYTKRVSDIVVQHIGQIPELMELPKQITQWAKINLAATGTYVAGLTAHHIYGSMTKDRYEDMKEQGLPVDEGFLNTQPSTVTSSILHEAPTVAMAAIAGWQSTDILKKVRAVEKAIV